MATATMKKYVDFTKPNTVPVDVTITIKEGRASVKALKKTESIMKIVSTFLLYAVIIALAFIVVLPFYWMIITSLKSNEEIRRATQTFFPEIVKWENYVLIFYSFDFGTYMFNTIVVAIFSTLGTLITTIFAAFAFARLKFAGREALFMLFLATMMIPGEMMVISNGLRGSSFTDISNEPQYGYQMAATVLVTVPLFLLFVFFRKYIMKGVGRAGIKG